MTMPRFLYALSFAIALLSIPVRSAPAAVHHGQEIAQLGLPTPAPSGAPNGVLVQGVYATAPVILDGIPLFRVAAPANASIAQLPLGARVSAIQTALAQLIAENSTDARATTVFDPNTLRVHARRVGEAVVLEAVDGKHPDPLPIVTVTTVDARANSVGVDSLASEWRDVLQSAIVRALVLRQPAVEQRSLQAVIRLAIVLVAVTLIVVFVLRELWREMASVEAVISRRNAAAGEPEAAAPEGQGATQRRRRILALQLRSLKPIERLRLLGAVVETLLWALTLAWFISATWSLSRFAETTMLAQTIARSGINVVTTIVFAILLSRVLDAIIGRTAGAWRLRGFANSDDRARSLLRVPTIARAVAGAKTFVLIFVVALSVLGQIGVPIGSVVTIGGLAAIALSLAAQNFVRDFLNGFLVLLEDQYVVGDYVTINAFSGDVERLTLRMVQLRDAAGDLVTVPHSSVVNVVNQSRNWSRIDYRVPVDPSADITKALAIVRAEIGTLTAADDWRNDVDEPIEWIGIDALSRDWVILRASVRTAPLRQFELRRQINARVLAAFVSAGIALGAPLPIP